MELYKYRRYQRYSSISRIHPHNWSSPSLFCLQRVTCGWSIIGRSEGLRNHLEYRSWVDDQHSRSSSTSRCDRSRLPACASMIWMIWLMVSKVGMNLVCLHNRVTCHDRLYAGRHSAAGVNMDGRPSVRSPTTVSVNGCVAA